MKSDNQYFKFSMSSQFTYSKLTNSFSFLTFLKIRFFAVASIFYPNYPLLINRVEKSTNYDYETNIAPQICTNRYSYPMEHLAKNERTLTLHATTCDY